MGVLDTVDQTWVFRRTGAQYRIIKVRTRWSDTFEDPLVEEIMLENLRSERRHWITMEGLLRKYEKVM